MTLISKALKALRCEYVGMKLRYHALIWLAGWSCVASAAAWLASGGWV